MPGNSTPEGRSARLNEQKDMLEMFALNAQIEQTYRWVAFSYSCANVLIGLTFALAVMTGWPWFLLLLIPVAIIILTTEVMVEEMHQQMLLYLERCGADVRDAPKPLFGPLRAWFRRLRR